MRTLFTDFKPFKLFKTFTLLTIFAISAKGGGMDSGGGMSITCSHSYKNNYWSLLDPLLIPTVYKSSFKELKNLGFVSNGSGIKRTWVFEELEMISYKNMKIDMGDKDAPYLEQVNFVLNRLGKFDKARSEVYKNELELFKLSQNNLNSALFQAAPLSDSTLKILPKFNFPGLEIICKEQLVISRKIGDLREGEVKYIINSQAWSQLNEQQKALIVLHELVYNEASEYFGHTNSDRIRYLVSLIASNNILLLDAIQYIDNVYRSLYLYDKVSSFGVFTSPANNAEYIEIIPVKSEGPFYGTFYYKEPFKHINLKYNNIEIIENTTSLDANGLVVKVLIKNDFNQINNNTKHELKKGQYWYISLRSTKPDGFKVLNEAQY